jgi:hypothetical protein
LSPGLPKPQIKAATAYRLALRGRIGDVLCRDIVLSRTPSSG